MFTAISEESMVVGDCASPTQYENLGGTSQPLVVETIDDMEVNTALGKEHSYEHVFIVTDTQKLQHMFTFDSKTNLTSKPDNSNDILRTIARKPPFTTLRYPSTIEC